MLRAVKIKMTELDLRSLKIVLVGEGVGKTSILDTFIERKLNLKELPRVYDNHVEMLLDPHQPVRYLLDLWDTSAHPGFDRIRPLTYSNVVSNFRLFYSKERRGFQMHSQYEIKMSPHSLSENNKCGSATVFMMLFSIEDRESLESVSTRWFKEIHTFNEAIPFYLVGPRSIFEQITRFRRKRAKKWPAFL
eukprot:TCALIF_03967-PA protein Name:"Similar to racF1 Rho-related protein racF1 (Dictyostelium discoideum)" AED:0.37 eAED:0.45 QI:0/0/0/0.66/0/0.33/3/0/190